jgi:hypothetical protein
MKMAWPWSKRRLGAPAPKPESAPKAAGLAAVAALATWACSSWAASRGWGSGMGLAGLPLWMLWAAADGVGAWLTAFHEFFHALAAWITGGSALSIKTSGHEGGATITQGGFYPFISCAGYLGCGAFGAFCVRRCGARSARGVCAALCVAVAAALLAKGQWADGSWVGLWQALGVNAVALWSLRSRHGSVALAYIGALFLASGLDDAAVLLVHATRETDAGLLARHLGMEFLAWPIALMYAAGMLLAWVWAARGLLRDARTRP